ncbi:MAG: metallophosphoesterase [Desulfuromonadaceae bacterium]|nr:metallophosphoesterase [Desulfuromonadaceae bacterium]
MTSSILRWLHLSDFHTGKDQYGQIQLFDSIIEHIENKIRTGQKPDIVFITGDVADKGKTEQYELFSNNFILPLIDIIGDTTKILMVPGNHDVNREEARATKRYGVLSEIPEFLDPTKQGLHERQVLFPRFNAYVQAEMHDWVTSGRDWLFSEEGFYTHILEIDKQQIGILGINTAWLSEGDNDKHKLTPGKVAIEAGLKKLKGCEYKFILGHHPLDWYDEDATSIRALLGKEGVIYIHGHLHRNSGYQEFGAGRKFLSLQSGATFQARESELWVNRLLWSELDLNLGVVKLHPLQWSKANQEWALDGIAYPEEYRTPGTDYWVLPLKEVSHRAKKSIKEIVGSESLLPQGWELIDKAFLNEKRRVLDDDAILSFFDGRVPSWREALSPQIPHRTIVGEIISELDIARKNGELRVSVILGAGGEGKSTVFMQTIVELASANAGWNILWIANPARDILWPSRFLDTLPKDKGTWLIVSDDADLIAKYVFESAKSFNRSDRKDIQFLLCTRDSDWYHSEANDWPWKDFVSYEEKRLRGLTNEDAKLIVEAWSRFGNKGLGSLVGLSLNEAVSSLFIASKSEEERDQNEGAFLGAMLRVRMGDALKSHVKSLLVRLDERKINNHSLLDAFAYIAAMHSEQLSILTKEILAETLSCKLSDVKKKITGPLGDEAAASTGGDRIFTRHRAIAEAAVDILSESFHVDFDEIFLELAESAYRIHHKGLFLPYFVKWKFLSEHFVANGNVSLAIRIDQALLKIDPSDIRLIVHLSRLLREADQPDLSLNVFRGLDHGVIGPVRGFTYEWGVAESVNNNYALGVWLFGIALSDQIEMKPIENRTATMCLSGIAMNSYRLFESYNDRIFIETCRAAVQIGLAFPKLNDTDKRLFGSYDRKSRAVGIKDVELKIAFDRMNKGIIAACGQKEAELPQWVTPATELTFKRISKLVGIEDI